MGKRRRVYDRIEKKFITDRLPAQKAIELRNLMNDLNPVRPEDMSEDKRFLWHLNGWNGKRYKVK